MFIFFARGYPLSIVATQRAGIKSLVAPEDLQLLDASGAAPMDRRFPGAGRGAVHYRIQLWF